MRILFGLALLAGVLASPTPSPDGASASSEDLNFLTCPVPAGGACSVAQWCIEGHICVSGICVAMGAVANGGSCAPSNFNIGSSAAFALNGFNAICTSGFCDSNGWKCGTRPTVGQACDPFGRDTCANSWCSYNYPWPSNCTAYVALGGNCGMGGDRSCGPNAFCNKNGQCATKLAANAECERDSACTSGFCDAGPTGTCMALTANGGDCKNSRECTSGLCNPMTLKCIARLAIGAVCGSGGMTSSVNPCVDGAVCSSGGRNNNQCLALKADGQQCFSGGGWGGQNDMSGCESGFCDGYICATKYPANGPCWGGGARCSNAQQACFQRQDRTCQNRIAVGAACDFSNGFDPNQCVTGAFCNITTDYSSYPSVTSGICSWLPNTGESCLPPYSNQMGPPSCRNAADGCVSVGMSGNRVCTPLLMDGANCTYSEECKSGLCMYDMGSGDYVCAAFVAVGQQCDPNANVCQGFCDISSGSPGMCKAPLADGVSCNSDISCASGKCLNGNCVTRKAMGAPCGRLFETLEFSCGAGQCGATQAAPMCQTPLQAGGMCANSTACAAGTACVNGVCTVLFADGHSCNPLLSSGQQGFPECAGKCNQATRSTCGAKFGTNASCVRDSQCESNKCDYNYRCVERVARGASCAGGIKVCARGQYCSSESGYMCIDAIALGGNCSGTSGECIDSYCDWNTMKCVALPGNAQSCATVNGNYVCASGFFCQYGSTCMPRKQAGVDCSIGSGECADGLYCGVSLNGGPGGNAKCMPTGSQGQTDCVYLTPWGGAEDSCNSQYTCAPPTGVCGAKGAAGAICRDGSDCASGDCDNSQCQAPGRTTGSPCNSQCPGGADCRPANPTCVATLANGQQCEDNDQCTSGACGSQGTCVAPAAIGAACGASPCVSGAFCKIDIPKCSALPGQGQLCGAIDGMGVCQPGLYCGWSSRCEPILNPGDNCQDSVQCGPDFVCNYASSSMTQMICQPPGQRDDPCRSAYGNQARDTCGNGLTCGTDDEWNYQQCSPKRATGRNCSIDLNCHSNNCVRGKCANLPQVAIGADCYDDAIGYGNDRWCPTGSFCKSASGDFAGPWTCSTQRLANGQPCPWSALVTGHVASRACNSGYCTPFSGTCTAKLADGAGCGIGELVGIPASYSNFVQLPGANDACQGFCKGTSTGWKCTAKAAVGQPCTNSSEVETCANSWCSTAAPKCTTKRATGATCDNFMQCASGSWCINGLCVTCATNPVTSPTRRPTVSAPPTNAPTIPPTLPPSTHRPTNVGETNAPSNAPTKYPTPPPTTPAPPTPPTIAPTEAVQPTSGPTPQTAVNAGVAVSAGKWVLALVCSVLILI